MPDTESGITPLVELGVDRKELEDALRILTRSVKVAKAGEAIEAAGVAAAVTDYTTGRLAALGVLCALSQRAREGGSWHVRVSLARTAMWIQSLPRAPAPLGSHSPSWE